MAILPKQMSRPSLLNEDGSAMMLEDQKGIRELPEELDSRLRELWQAHPNFVLIPHAQSFFRKMTMALGLLESHVAQI